MKIDKMTAETKAIALFRKAGGMMRTAQAIKAGVHPVILYKLRDQGLIESLERGFYKLTDQSAGSDPQLAQVSLKYKNSVLCLTSALFIHELTTQIPRQVCIALPKGTHSPSESSSVHFIFLADKQYKSGIEEKNIGGIKFKVYDPEKTIVDCFKFRNKIGSDLAVEALKEWKKKRPKNLKKLLEYARICRVEKIMAPYIEALS
ncbi:MAG: type IV toxin-antitoxin system AbiEi family antitoxin domain-containing protein [Bdellovibrionaceae bacterium]|nr:type IV toxin-antitoxin system AbiEi family antitoxin domain-containing protein [Pseudobdellovibrionaceae bacterium]